MTPERQSPLQWPAGWKRTHNPQHSRFDTSPERATKGLLAEIERLGGRLPVISSNAQYRQDGMPYARQGRIDDTGVAVYFQRKGKQVVFACDTYIALHDNIHAITKTIEALRAIERHGASEMMDRAFTGFAALPPPIAAGMKRPWHEVLGVPAAAGRDAIQAAYRQLSSQHHPDKGGSAARMAEINQARDEALKGLA